MARKRCNTCLGEYDDPLPDGQRYFHACPPVEEFFDEQGAPITRDAAEAIMKAGGRYRHRYVERPDARDENAIKSRAKEDRGKPKKEGNGTVDAPATAADAIAGTELVDVPPPKVL